MSDLLRVDKLCVSAGESSGRYRLVDNVSFEIRSGEVLGLVGESGSGKSMIAMALMRLLPRGVVAEGEVMLEGRNLLSLDEHAMRRVRGGNIALIFQEPVSALNPAFTIGNQIIAAIRAHSDCTRQQARKRAIELLDQVRIPEPDVRLDLYPHQLSGGMCQRVMIAMAIAGGARLIIADEPTTSLDVTIQEQIVQLLEQLVRETGLSVLFISHDLGIVSQLCDRIAVAYAGELVETGDARTVLNNPLHPYTRALVNCVPSMKAPGVLLPGISGYPPMPGAWPAGCHYFDRCSHADTPCERPQPENWFDRERMVRCWRARENAVA
jgi:peptide/nickel transport system permease protein